MSIHSIGTYRSNWIAAPAAAVAASPAISTYTADRYVAASVPSQPWPATQPPPGAVVSGPLSPTALAQLQSMRAELALLETQLSALLALAAPTPWAGPPGVLPVPMAPPPLPIPPVAQPLPPLPAPPPVLPPVVPAPAPVAPVVQPTPTGLPFNGLVAGTRMMLAPGTSVMGFDVSGTAAVRESSPQVLDMVAKGAAMFGLLRRTYALRVEMLPGNKVRVGLHEIGRNGKPQKKVFAGKLDVIESRPGMLTIKDPEGKPGSILQARDGSLTVQHPQGTVKFLLRGVAPLVAGVDDADNARPLA